MLCFYVLFVFFCLFVCLFLIAAQVTYNSQKREQRIFKQPGGGGVVEEAVLLTGNHLQQRLNEIYSMSDDEDDMIESTDGENKINLFSSTVIHHPDNGSALYGNVRQVKMQLGL
jgi:hypothetical protein